MAEDFHGVKPISADLKPDQQTLRDRQDDWGNPDDSGSALDALLAQSQGATPADDNATPPAPAPAPAPAPGDATPPAGDDDLPDPSTVKLPDGVKPPDLDDIQPKGDQGTPPASGDDPYPDAQLPPNVRGKTAEAWANLKTRFKTDLSAREEEINTLKAKLAEHEQKLSDPVPEETKKELEELRQFRARLDVEADPGFQAQFDNRIATARNFVLTQLGNAGFSKEAIAKVKEVGVENVDWDALDEKIPGNIKRLIQSRLDEIEVVKFDRQAKLDEAKANIKDYIEKQRANYSERAQGHHKETEKELQTFMQKLEFLKEPEPLKPTASKEEKDIHTFESELRKSIRDSIEEAKRDDSPYMRALLIAGMAQLLNLKPRFEQLAGAYKILEAKHTKAVEWIEQVKNAGRPRPRDGGDPTPPPPTVDYNQSAGDALDALRKRMAS